MRGQAQSQTAPGGIAHEAHPSASEIRGFLLDDDWKFDFDDEKGIFRFGVNIDGKMTFLVSEEAKYKPVFDAVVASIKKK